MRKKFKFIIIVISLLFLSSCTEPNIKHLKTQTPKIDLKDFFHGKILAKGYIQNWRGEVIKTFTATFLSYWDDNYGVIMQNITFNNGATVNRKLSISALNNDKFLLSAQDIEDVGVGTQSGNAAFFSYDLLVPFMKGEISLSASEWLYMLPDNSIITDISLYKFGIKVGKIICYMTKVTETEGRTVPNRKLKKTSSD